MCIHEVCTYICPTGTSSLVFYQRQTICFSTHRGALASYREACRNSVPVQFPMKIKNHLEDMEFRLWPSLAAEVASGLLPPAALAGSYWLSSLPSVSVPIVLSDGFMPFACGVRGLRTPFVCCSCGHFPGLFLVSVMCSF